MPGYKYYQSYPPLLPHSLGRLQSVGHVREVGVLQRVLAGDAAARVDRQQLLHIGVTVVSRYCQYSP
jgi:hypothetical protein